MNSNAQFQMTKLLPILFMTILLSGEMEVDGDLKVTGTIQNDSLAQVINLQQQEIAFLLASIAGLKLQIEMLESQMEFLGQELDNADCFGLVGGNAVIDECGICGGDGIPEGGCDCDGNVLDVCGECGCHISHELDDCHDLIDIDGNGYYSVQIGYQLWMAENLKVTHYNNGDAIATGLHDTTWSGYTEGAYAMNYGNSSIGLFTNLPEQLDKAVINRIQGRFKIDGAQSENDFIDQDYLWWKKFDTGPIDSPMRIMTDDLVAGLLSSGVAILILSIYLWVL